MNDDDIEDLAEEAWEAVATIGDDTDRFTKEESAEFYEQIEVKAKTAAAALREELS